MRMSTCRSGSIRVYLRLQLQAASEYLRRDPWNLKARAVVESFGIKQGSAEADGEGHEPDETGTGEMEMYDEDDSADSESEEESADHVSVYASSASSPSTLSSFLPSSTSPSPLSSVALLRAQQRIVRDAKLDQQRRLAEEEEKGTVIARVWRRGQEGGENETTTGVGEGAVHTAHASSTSSPSPFSCSSFLSSWPASSLSSSSTFVSRKLSLGGLARLLSQVRQN